jgi:hypothetical protein
VNEIIVSVYVCFHCGNFFGSSSMSDLEEEPQQRPGRPQTGITRAHCPTPECRQKLRVRERRFIKLVAGEA